MYVKSSWFDFGNNKYQKIGCDGFNLYLNLFRYRLFNQENDYTFICSISLIRKDTGYPAQLVLDLLKLLSKHKIIKVDLARWDRLHDDKGNIVIDKILVIEAIDKPNTKKRMNEEGKEVDIPETDDDYYISLDMPLIQHYIDQGLNERYLGLHCLINKHSNKTEGKCWISINKMAATLGFGDKTVNSMIHELNRKYLLYSRYDETEKKRINKKGEKEDGKQFEHFLLRNMDYQEQFIAAHKDSIDRNIRKWDRKKKL